MEVIRLVTIHPLLAHFAIGGLPFVLLGYGLGLRRRNPAWIFVGDVGLFVTAIAVVITAVFGLVSNAAVPWPGGNDTWRWLHLGFGAASMLTFVALALSRWSARRKGRDPAEKLLAGVVTATVLVGITGWIGGEVLVFHSGMAVKGSASGAFSPHLSWLGPGDPPRDLDDAMGAVRGHWADIQTRVGAMVVQRPTDEGFEVVAGSAERLSTVAAWLSDNAGDGPKRATLVSMAMALDGAAKEISGAARAKSLPRVARALGDATATCAECHAELRTEKD